MTAINQQWGELGSCYPSQGHGGQETSHGSFAFAEDPAAPACCDVCGAGLVVVAAPASAVVPAGSGDDGPGAPGVVGGAPGDGGTVVAGNDVAVVDGPGAGVAVVVGDLEVDAAAVVGVDAAGPGDGAGDGAVLVGGGGGDGAAVVGGGPGDGAVVVGGGPGDGDGAVVVVGPGDGAPVVDVVAVVAAVVGGAVVVGDGAVVVGDGAVVVVGDGAVVVAAVVAAVVGGAVVVGDGAVVEPGPGGTVPDSVQAMAPATVAGPEPELAAVPTPRGLCAATASWLDGMVESGRMYLCNLSECPLAVRPLTSYFNCPSSWQWPLETVGCGSIGPTPKCLGHPG